MDSWDQLSAESRDILKAAHLTKAEYNGLGLAAEEAKKHAYCPSSKFHVGASILMLHSLPQQGEVLKFSMPIIKGCNVENASYPVGICAERVAISSAIAMGYKTGDIRAVAVSTDITPGASPCGMCRQFIREFCPPDTPILMIDENSECIVSTIGALLPLSFGPDALARNLT